jgi:hypothetical protein
MHEEPLDIPPLPQPDEVSGKAVAALICSLLGLTHSCPCIGAVLAIALGYGEKSGVGRAAFIVGLVTLALDAMFVLAIVILQVVNAAL